MSPDAETLDRAVAEVLRALAPHVDEDWSLPAGTLTWSCWMTAEHIAHDLLAYAGQVAACPSDDYLPFDLAVRPDTAPARVLDVVQAAGGLLSSALRTAGPETRGWHWGPTDPSGFAALGMTEALVHGYDIASGLGLAWRPPADLAAAALARVMPHILADAPPGPPGDVLLWATGRIPLAGRPPTTNWVYRAATGKS